jgi:hypothetical protein
VPSNATGMVFGGAAPCMHYPAMGMATGGAAQYMQQSTMGDNSYLLAPSNTLPQPDIDPVPRVTKRTLQELQDQSEELLNSRKRRRRVRGRGQLAPDAPGLPPRYKSETTIDECKVFLQLNNEAYSAVRSQFMSICNEAGIVKKTQCQPGVWEVAKDRLIRENPHLNIVMNAPHPEADKVANALEVICADVTKSIRVLGKRISLADANNGLGMNPSESKHARKLFYDILKADNFTTRMECGDERWEAHYNLWLTKSEPLLRVKQQGIDEQTRKYLNMLMRDAMKRLNVGRTKNDPRMRQLPETAYGVGPGPAKGKFSKGARDPKEAKELDATVSSSTARPRTHPRNTASTGPVLPLSLDPALLPFPAAGPSVPTAPAPSANIPAYFRLAPTSHLIGHHPKLWLGKLTALSLAALHAAAKSKAGAAKVGQVYGIVKNGEGEGEAEEDKYLIDGDDELGAYLEAAGEGSVGGKVVFEVELKGGYA